MVSVDLMRDVSAVGAVPVSMVDVNTEDAGVVTSLFKHSLSSTTLTPSMALTWSRSLVY